ncbi:S-adenosyl-L-methionine-dependent methyltransferase [Hesseltinella vesiculosa]|uniref:S-adenosyl-L-methionine-dependent methyltransferase n=1 Tax=Hesseltinella vesiculosa TaxID=101127 RepID=A0A1X2GUE5_9FUNG|nr:S-adenosyl-L-methionine-dependent methyltransferase [Hesseltinella vesiculosa]
MYRSILPSARILGNRLRLAEEAYCVDHSTPFAEPVRQALSDLTKETIATFPNPHIMSSPAATLMLRQWVSIVRPAKALEIGAFTGVSAIAMASALPPSGRLISLEKDPEPLTLATKYVKKSGLSDKVSFIQGPADKSLQGLADQDQSFDLIFMDADKGGYVNYLDFILNNGLLSERGTMLVDNVLYWGQVHRVAGGYEEDNVEVSKNIRRLARKVHDFNTFVKADDRIQAIMLPVFDGFTVITRRG